MEFLIFSCSELLSGPCSPVGSRDPDWRCCPRGCCSSAIPVMTRTRKEGRKDLTSRPRAEPHKPPLFSAVPDIYITVLLVKLPASLSCCFRQPNAPESWFQRRFSSSVVSLKISTRASRGRNQPLNPICLLHFTSLHYHALTSLTRNEPIPKKESILRAQAFRLENRFQSFGVDSTQHRIWCRAGVLKLNSIQVTSQ